MKFHAPILLAAAVVVVAQVRSPGSTDRVAIQQEVEARALAMAQAFERGDLRAVAGFYADDGRIYASGTKIEGRRAIDELWLKIRHPSSWLLQTIDVGGSRDEPYLLVRSTLVEKNGVHVDSSLTMCLMTWRRGRDGILRIQNDVYGLLPHQ